MHDREVDLGLCDDVDEVREDILGNESNDLHDLSVGEAGGLDRLKLDVADPALSWRGRGCSMNGDGDAMPMDRRRRTVPSDEPTAAKQGRQTLPEPCSQMAVRAWLHDLVGSR